MVNHPLAVVEYDSFGNLRLAEVPLGLIVKRELQKRAADHGKKLTWAEVTIGYELRCADPIPVDVEYVQQLGWGAVRYLLGTGEEGWPEDGAMISIQAGEIVPIPFSEIMNVKTGKTRVRRVDITSTPYKCVRAYMTRLEQEDFDDANMLERLSAAAGIPLEDIRTRFLPAIDR